MEPTSLHLQTAGDTQPLMRTPSKDRWSPSMGREDSRKNSAQLLGLLLQKYPRLTHPDDHSGLCPHFECQRPPFQYGIMGENWGKFANVEHSKSPHIVELNTHEGSPSEEFRKTTNPVSKSRGAARCPSSPLTPSSGHAKGALMALGAVGSLTPTLALNFTLDWLM